MNGENTQESNNKKEKSKNQNPNLKKNKPARKEFAPYGNYRNYYGYRIDQGLDEDPRLKVMRKEWFEGKNCLDIGCNNGLITIQIAKKFHCRSILGIDIDSNRIEDACWILRKFARKESVDKRDSKSSELKDEQKSNGAEQSINTSSDGNAGEVTENLLSERRGLLEIVYFKQENFVQKKISISESYDTILCLSVTKWIHLNWGDDGLINLFSKVWHLLHLGGIFVLEPQPWRSYEKNRLVSEKTAKNYSNILFPPEHFQEILLDKIGFRKVEDLTSSLTGSKTGFNRPILAFYK